jgi:hypothetical protein
MEQISDLKQWLDSQRVKSENPLSPHHTVEDDFTFNNGSHNTPFVPSPKFKEDRYLWYEDGKNEHPEMNLDRVAEKEPMTDYEKAKALWYKNAWESVQPVNTEADNSNTFKKAKIARPLDFADPGMPTAYYHVSPSENRESILTQGLVPQRKYWSDLRKIMPQLQNAPEGVYLWDSFDNARTYINAFVQRVP